LALPQNVDERVVRLTGALSPATAGWRFEPVMRALQALRGIDEIAAVGLVAEIGDIGRFAHPPQLMGYLDLVPTEASSGERLRRGAPPRDAGCREHKGTRHGADRRSRIG
jgi:transposase